MPAIASGGAVQPRRRPHLESHWFSIGASQEEPRAKSQAERGAHLSVPLQLGHERPLVEERLELLVHVVVTQLFKRSGSLLLLVPRVMETGGVHHHDGCRGEVTGCKRPSKTGYNHTDLPG